MLGFVIVVCALFGAGFIAYFLNDWSGERWENSDLCNWDPAPSYDIKLLTRDGGGNILIRVNRDKTETVIGYNVTDGLAGYARGERGTMNIEPEPEPEPEPECEALQQWEYLFSDLGLA